MSKLLSYFKDYESYHLTAGNKACHFIGIPSITITLLGLLSYLKFFEVPGLPLLQADAGTLLWLGASIWYLTLHTKLGISFSLFGLGCYFVGRAMPLSALWTVFILGWIVQYFGHLYYEKKSPAFTKNILHILIGPLWIFNRLVKMV